MQATEGGAVKPGKKKRSARGCFLWVLGFILIIVVIIVVLVATSHSPADDPSLAASAQAALAANATFAPLVDTVTATDDGTVTVTLNQTSAALAGTSGNNGAEKIGAYVNAAVLDAVPAAKSVATFDADNKMLELSSRK